MAEPANDGTIGGAPQGTGKADSRDGSGWRPDGGWFLTVVAGLLCVAGIGWLDYVTGPDIVLSLAYAMPVVACGWWRGWQAALTVTVASALACFAADVPLHPEAYLPISVWNASTRLVTFGVLGLFAARVRRDRARLEGLNGRLARALDAEHSLARTDVLTELPNTRAFLDMVRSASDRGRRAGRPLSLAYVDLDNFKRANDEYGHAGGDDLLRLVAKAIRRVLRTGDVPARLGGDEFAVLLPDIPPDGAANVARRLLGSVREACQALPRADVGSSIGLAWFEIPPREPEEAIRRADAAMYEAKSQGKGRVVVREFRSSAPPP